MSKHSALLFSDILEYYYTSLRLGAPHQHIFGPLIRRLEDTGLLAYWIEDVIARRVREIKATTQPYNFSSFILASIADMVRQILCHNRISN